MSSARSIHSLALLTDTVAWGITHSCLAAHAIPSGSLSAKLSVPTARVAHTTSTRCSWLTWHRALHIHTLSNALPVLSGFPNFTTNTRYRRRRTLTSESASRDRQASSNNYFFTI